MTTPPNEYDTDTLLKLFDSVKTGIIVINRKYDLIMANKTAFRILEMAEDSLQKSCTCFNLLYHRTEPCEGCPVNMEENSIESKQKSLTLKTKDNRDVFIRIFYTKWDGNFVLTLFDVTQEVTVVRKIDLIRKELQTKNILLERRRQGTMEEQHNLEQLLDTLPEALVSVSAAYEIQRKNKAVSEKLPFKNASTCYELMGQDLPCEHCPAESGFDQADMKKKGHFINDRYFTETIIKSPFDDGGLLLFADTTRQIQLTEKIRKQRETITRKNEILSGLVDISSKMQKDPDPESVTGYFLQTFLDVVNSDSAVVISDDIRAGNLWFTVQKGISKKEMLTTSRAYLSREIQSRSSDMIPEESLPWKNSTQIQLKGGDGERVGVILIKDEFNEEDNKLAKLFFEPFGAYVHNKLLMRKLEEKANTDPMTGLYNRGYLDQAIKEETEKLKKFNIQYSIVMADVNRLKKANDDYGHEAGDNLILTVADLLEKEVRPVDVVARTGGDEFLILLADCNNEGANNFINRLTKKTFHEVSIEVGKNERFPVTVSFGAAGTDKYKPEELIKEADRTMYENKEAFYAKNKNLRYR